VSAVATVSPLFQVQAKELLGSSGFFPSPYSKKRQLNTEFSEKATEGSSFY
jgi:hypothetical protein